MSLSCVSFLMNMLRVGLCVRVFGKESVLPMQDHEKSACRTPMKRRPTTGSGRSRNVCFGSEVSGPLPVLRSP